MSEFAGYFEDAGAFTQDLLGDRQSVILVGFSNGRDLAVDGIIGRERTEYVLSQRTGEETQVLRRTIRLARSEKLRQLPPKQVLRVQGADYALESIDSTDTYLTVEVIRKPLARQQQLEGAADGPV